MVSLPQDLKGEHGCGTDRAERAADISSVRDEDVLFPGFFDRAAQAAHLSADGQAEAGREGEVIQADSIFALGADERDPILLQRIRGRYSLAPALVRATVAAAEVQLRGGRITPSQPAA